MTPPIDFYATNAAALSNARSLLQELIRGGKIRSLEYVVRNPRRDDKTLGSFKINYGSGVWKDFETGDGGGDLISLVAYLRGGDQATAARKLADILGVPFVKSNGHKETQQSQRSQPQRLGHHEQNAEGLSMGRRPASKRKLNNCAGTSIRSGGRPMRIKIKMRDGHFLNWYRVFSSGVPIGWQAKKPVDYIAIPYVTAALNPFDFRINGR